MTDDERYTAAVQTFELEPEALTQDQIDALARVDEKLGQRAVTKRAAMIQKAAEVRHRAAMGEPPAKENRVEVMADVVIDAITLALAKPRNRIKALEERNAGLERAIANLEERLDSLALELAAKDAVDDHARR